MSKITDADIANLINQIKLADDSNLVENISPIIIQDKKVYFTIYTNKSNYEANREISFQVQGLIQEQFELEAVISYTNPKDSNLKENPLKKKKLPLGVKKIILSISGKGGVGKSTMASFFAQSLAEKGMRVGLVDADIFGPSIPKIFGVENLRPELKGNLFIPIEKYGVKLISIGFFVNGLTSLPFRGPMISKLLNQLLLSVNWQDSDFLIIDMPPGTGDIALTILEDYEIFGAIVTTTPQKLARLDVIKSVEMLHKFKTPVLALFNNMSYLLLENGEKNYIFGDDEAEGLKEFCKTDWSFTIPIDSQIAKACDNGELLINKVKLLEWENFIGNFESSRTIF